jgi:hypothetical protein
MRTLSVGSCLAGLSIVAAASPGCSFRSARQGRSTATAPSAGAPAASPAPARPAFVAPNLQHTHAELASHIETETAGFKKATEAPGKLEAFAPVEVPIKRGVCYKVAFMLDEGVEFSEHAKQSIQFAVQVEGQPLARHATAFGPGGVVDLGCPNEGATAKVDIRAEWGAAKDKSKLHDLGQGGFRTLVFEKQISDKELGARNQMREEARRRGEALDAEFKRGQCKQCRDTFYECIERHRGDCRRTLDRCEREKRCN